MKPNFLFPIESLTLTKSNRITITQRIQISKTNYKNGDSTPATYRGDYGLNNRLTMQAIGKIVKKFEETGVVRNIERPVHQHCTCSAENIATVNEIMC